MKIRNLHDANGDTPEDASWVKEGHGRAVVYYAGATTYLYTGTEWFVRFELPAGETEPEGFAPGQENHDGGVIGWVPTTSPLPHEDVPVPGTYLALPDGRTIREADAEVLDESGKRNLSALVKRAKKRGGAGVIFDNGFARFKHVVRE